MKIAIISDIHDNHLYLKQCVEYCKKSKVETIICCGDITTNETVQQLTSFEKPVYYIRGNADVFNEKIIESLPNLHYLGRTGEVVIGERKIGLCHEPFFFADLLPHNYYIIFYGHTHKPWLESKEETYLVNPGTLGGFTNASTFAIWETSKPLPELVQTNSLHASSI